MKRFFDFLVTLLVIPLILPLGLLLSAMVMLDGGPALYVQERVGRNGRPFRLFKLRSMVVDADRQLAAYLDGNPAAKAEWEEKQKLRHDPRITAVGRFLRKTSLDEMPQLWNVLWGEMSLVGPRPMMPEQMPLYPGQAYYRLRPGLTGPWQISERNDVSFAGRAFYDTQYAEQVSPATDMLVIAKTFRVVLRGTGC